jgi:hypothetical protein
MKILWRYLSIAVAALCSNTIAAAVPAGQLETPSYSAAAAISVRSLYSNFLSHNSALTVQAAQIGAITIVRFLENGACPSAGCYTTALRANPQGGFTQVLVLRAPEIQYYKGKGSYPVLRVNGIDWDYTFHSGYIADLKSAGEAFTATLRPQGTTAQDIDAALSASGWPKNLPPLIHEVQPGGGAPTTLLVAPDETTTAGEADCAQDACHIWFLVYQKGAWTASTGTTGTGLLAVLPPDQAGVARIGVGEDQGFFTFSWDTALSRWVETGSTFSKVPAQGAQ